MSQRRRTSLLAVFALLVAFLVTSVASTARPVQAAGAHPRLLFTAADVPGIRARAGAGEGARAWVTLKERLDAYVESPENSPWHITPAKIGHRDSNGNLDTYADQNAFPTALIDLAFGYVVTGDTRYSTLVKDCLLALADQGWPFWQDMGQYLGAGDLLRGVGLSFDWVYDTISPADRLTIVSGLNNRAASSQLGGGRIVDVVHLAGPGADPGSNWSGVTAGGAGLALLAVQGEPGSPTDLPNLLAGAQSRVAGYMSTAIGVDGEGGEGWTYASYGLHGALPFAFALRNTGGTDLIAAYPRLGQLANWVAATLIPAAGFDGTIPLNDSARDALGDEVLEQLWEVTPANPLVSWLWERTLGPAGVDRYAPGRTPPYLPAHNCVPPGTNAAVYTVGCGWSSAEELHLIFNQHGRTPAGSADALLPKATHFDDHGIVTGRTGWSAGAGDVVSAFVASRGAAGHTQEDVGQFTLYGYGGDFAVDSGYGHNYSCGTGDVPPAVDGCDPSDHSNLAGQAAGHNLVLIDDDARTQRGARTRTSRQTVPEFLSLPGLAFAHADTRTQFPADPPLAARDWLFLHAPGRPVLLAIGDQLQRDAALHRYNWQLHTNASNAVSLRGSGFAITSPSGATLTGLTARNGDLLQSTRSVFGSTAFAGSAFDRPAAHTLLKQVDAVTHVDHAELAVMALTPPGGLPATLARLDVPGSNTLETTYGGLRDVVVQRLLGGGGAVYGPSGLTLDGQLGYAVEGAGEALLRQGRRLSAYGRDYVLVTNGVASVAVSSGTVVATGSPGATYRVFSPRTTSVTLNGQAVPSSHSGDYVSF